MKRLSGFSLMEMMVVLLIVAVVAAASAPMINKKMVASVDGSPWSWVGNSGSIAYNINKGALTASVGYTSAPQEAKKPRLYLDSNNAISNPQLAFGQDGNNVLKLEVRNNNISFSNSDQPAAHSNSVAIGVGSFANGSNSIAMGRLARTGSLGAIGIGNWVNANAIDTIAIGNQALAYGQSAIAIGEQAGASEQYAGKSSIAIGQVAIANKDDSIAIGREAGANIAGDIAIGADALADKVNSIAIGVGANASRYASIAIGEDAGVEQGGSSVDGDTYTDTGRAIAIGRSAKAKNKNAISLGVNATSSGDYSTAIGAYANADTQDSIAIGGGGGNNNYFTNASGHRAIAIGANAKAQSANSIAIGPGAVAEAENSIAIGRGVHVTGSNHIVIGDINTRIYIPGTLVVRGCFQADGDVALARSGQIYSRFFGYGEYKTGKIWRTTGGHLFYEPASIPDWSDRRLKNVGKAFVAGLEEIKKLEVFNYTFKKDPTKTLRVGVMAQDLQKIFPNAVFKGDDGFLRIRMEDMFYALVNAVKELDAKIDLLAQKQKKIDELEDKIAKLEKRLEKLEKSLK